jgi:serine/threonine-protein kinase
VTGEGQVDARSDLYALGAVAYLLLTGAPVFEARTVLEVYAHHLHTPPESPSRRLGRPVPSELEALVLECLAKSPDDRPQSAHDVLQGLDRCGPYAGWSDAAAERWWERYRRSGTDATAAAGRRAPAVERAG